MAEAEYSNQLSSVSSRYTFPLRAKAAGARMFRMMTMITPSISQAAQMGPARLYGGGWRRIKLRYYRKDQDYKRHRRQDNMAQDGKLSPAFAPVEEGDREADSHVN